MRTVALVLVFASSCGAAATPNGQPDGAVIDKQATSGTSGCNSLVNTAPSIEVVIHQGEAMAPMTGGTIVSGTYYQTAADSYPFDIGCTFPTHNRDVAVITADSETMGTIQTVHEGDNPDNGSSVTTRGTFSYTKVASSSIATTSLCFDPPPGDAGTTGTTRPYDYTATASELELVACSTVCGCLVSTFTRQ